MEGRNGGPKWRPQQLSKTGVLSEENKVTTRDTGKEKMQFKVETKITHKSRQGGRAGRQPRNKTWIRGQTGTNMGPGSWHKSYKMIQQPALVKPALVDHRCVGRWGNVLQVWWLSEGRLWGVVVGKIRAEIWDGVVTGNNCSVLMYMVVHGGWLYRICRWLDMNATALRKYSCEPHHFLL